MSVRVDHAVVSGTFSLDGETHEVDNNVWVVGDDDQCLVIDAPHDVDAILEVVAGRAVKAIVCTHAHDDHVRVAPELRGEERMAALEAECERLVALGARRLYREEPSPPMAFGHITMADPEGNEFCLD